MQQIKLNGNTFAVSYNKGQLCTTRLEEMVSTTPAVIADEITKTCEESQTAGASSSGTVPILKDRILYQELISIANLEAGLARTKDGKAAGLDGETKSQFTSEKLTLLHKELRLQKYSPTPSKRVGIPKHNGGVRYLGISSQRDKVVQGALLNLLEVKLEEIFLNVSKGFRPGKNCHNALKEIKYNWQSPTWLINVDITKAFDSLQHVVLLKLCKEHCDQATVELISKLIRAGYVDIHNLNDRTEYLTEGTPQGSLISPILCNLYLHELDKMVVDKLLPRWNFGTERKYLPEYLTRLKQTAEEKAFLREWPEFRKALTIAKHNKRGLADDPSRDPHDENFRRLYYVRYADDFMLGFSGTKVEALEIQSDISKALHSLGLEPILGKSSITHCKERDLLYLGVFITYTTTNRIAVNPKKGTPDFPNLRSISMNNAQLRVPVQRILLRAIERGHAKKRPNGSIRATSKRQWSSLSESQIVNRYSAVIRGILQYYSCVNQRSDLWSIVSLYRKACALTLADKLKLRTAAQVFKKFGPMLTIRSATSKKEVCLDYPESLKTKIVFKTGSPTIQLRLTTGEHLNPLEGSYKSNLGKGVICEALGCESTDGLEAHHVNPMKSSKEKNGFKRSITSKARKTVTLCKRHHNLIHNKTTRS